MYHVAATFLLLAGTHLGGPKTVSGDWIEVNAMLLPEARQTLCQVILWEMARDEDGNLRPRVVCWHMYDPATMPILTDKDTCSVRVQGVLLRAKQWIETETCYDPERRNRRWFPQECRPTIPW